MPKGSEDQPTSPLQGESPAKVVPAEVSTGAPENEAGVMDAIRKLRSQGYTARQVKERFGYPRSTVDQVYAEVIKPEGKPEEKGDEPGLPVTVKGTEIVTPEYIMRSLADGSEDWQLRLEGMMLLRAAQRMVMDDVEIMRSRAEADAKLIEPVLKVMKEAREEQDAAAQRAKASVAEAATRAAEEAAARVAAYFEQKKPDTASGPSPLEEVFARLLQTTLTNLMSKLLPGSGNVPAGFRVEKGA